MKNQLLGILPPYRAKKILVINDQNTSDIITEMKRAHKLHARDYDKIANFFWAGNVPGTCKKIFDFLKRHVKYNVEPDTRQSVKSPAAILATGQYKSGYNDCKHYSLFIAGILDSLRRQGKPINWNFRFANYRFFQSTPHHVFVVCRDLNGNEIWIDPVLINFNERKPYINKIDVMALYQISGIGCNECNATPANYLGGMDIIAGKKRTKRKAKRRAEKAAGYCRGKVGKKILLAPARNAFLALVGLNVRKMAVKLYTKLQNPDTKKRLFSKWCRLGGNAKKLENTILKAYRKYSRKRKISGFDDAEMIGAPITALLATAGPILVALREFLGKAQELKDTATNLFSRGGGGSDEMEMQTDEQIETEPGEVGFLGMGAADLTAIAIIGIGTYKAIKTK